MSGAYRLSKRNIQQLLVDCFEVELALGSISALERATSEALREPVAEARCFVQQQAVVHVDETGWREAHKRAWLWTAVTHSITVFVVRRSRGSEVAKELLGEAFAGIRVSDRWSGYRWVPIKRHQLCWSHLIRDFRQIAEAGGSAGALGETLGMGARQLFHWWYWVRDGTLQRSSAGWVCHSARYMGRSYNQRPLSRTARPFSSASFRRNVGRNTCGETVISSPAGRGALA